MNAQEPENLKTELRSLFNYVQRVRQEIAAIDHPVEDEHHFDKMGDQLDAIVKATEEATNTIMAMMEKNEDAVGKLRDGITDADQIALLDQISENGMNVFQACSFQDITGQRVSKLVKSLTYVEDRVDALVEIWGKAKLQEVEVLPISEKTADEKLLHGPQMEGEGISQDEIDKLFD
jgi:chemotaxis protein CheZ